MLLLPPLESIPPNGLNSSCSQAAHQEIAGPSSLSLMKRSSPSFCPGSKMPPFWLTPTKLCNHLDIPELYLARDSSLLHEMAVSTRKSSSRTSNDVDNDMNTYRVLVG